MTFERKLRVLKQAKIALDTLPDRLSDLNEDDLEIVVPTVTEFFAAVRRAMLRLQPIPHPFKFRYDDDGTWGVQYPGDRYPITVCDTEEQAETLIAECIRVAGLATDDDAEFSATKQTQTEGTLP